MGEFGHLHGLAPLGLFLQTLGIRQLTAKEILLDGFYPFSMTIHVQYHKVHLDFYPDRTEIQFSEGQKVTIDQPGLQRVTLSSVKNPKGGMRERTKKSAPLKTRFDLMAVVQSQDAEVAKDTLSRLGVTIERPAQRRRVSGPAQCDPASCGMREEQREGHGGAEPQLPPEDRVYRRAAGAPLPPAHPYPHYRGRGHHIHPGCRAIRGAITWKLIISILRDIDRRSVSGLSPRLVSGSPLIASSGGFWKRGNTTLLIGCEDEQVDHALELVRSECLPRLPSRAPPTPQSSC